MGTMGTAMGTAMDRRAGTRASTRLELVGRLRARREELERAIAGRIRDGADRVSGEEDPEYLAGLRAAISAAIEHALAGIELWRDAEPPIPPEAVAQAQRAARAGIGVETVIRRYVLGSNMLGDFLLQEAGRAGLAESGEAAREMLAVQAGLLDRLISAVTAEHRLETERAGRSPERRRNELVQRLLAGGRCDSAELGYELERWHVGVVASGAAACQALKAVACELGVQLLCLARGEDSAWAWLGATRPPAPREIERAHAAGGACGDTVLALGEPGQGVAGWRLTHLQAQAAQRVALLSGRPLTRYADVALLAYVLRDEALARSLVDIYLSPLGGRRNGGAVLRDTLRAYFAAERNASSAAAALGVARHTVQNRLRAIEERLGLAIRTRQAELEVALRVEELGDGAGAGVAAGA